ncbi:MAG: pilus assembly protein [Deltaproteobacteria bacterium]|nr:pilus assembly protein [Deltaproteobacteria bacterium]
MSRRIRRAESGQALVETAIVMPVMVFVVLGALQIMLVEHGRIMAEYAAYNAARAGVVHNANWNVMRNAALIAALPVYLRTDTVTNLLLAWAKTKAAAEITEAVDTGAATLERMAGDLLGVELPGLAQDVSLIDLEVDKATENAFAAWKEWVELQQGKAIELDLKGALLYPAAEQEIDFDDAAFNHWVATEKPEVQPGRLGVDVRLLYPLKIPLVNKIIFEVWIAQVLLDTQQLRSDLSDWSQFKAKVARGAHAGQYLDEAVRQGDDDGPLDRFFTSTQWSKEVRTLRYVAERYGVYLIPLHGTHAMQMQSNLFAKNQREPVWFTVE